MNQNEIGKIIKEIRNKNKYTQQQLADILGVTYQAVSKWENGKNIPDISILQIISNKFDIDLEELITGKKKRKSILFLIFPILIVLIILFAAFFKNNEAYEFQNLISANQDFEVQGVIAFSDTKTSLYISDIKSNMEDNHKYKVLECTLFELDGVSHKMISKCGDVTEEPICESQTLSELLKTISFNIKNFSRSCKNFENNDLYLEINAIDDNDKNIVYKVPLLLESKCK